MQTLNGYTYSAKNDVISVSVEGRIPTCTVRTYIANKSDKIRRALLAILPDIFYTISVDRKEIFISAADIINPKLFTTYIREDMNISIEGGIKYVQHDLLVEMDEAYLHIIKIDRINNFPVN